MAEGTTRKLTFEPLEATGIPGRWVQQKVRLFRAKIPGGWLILHEGATDHNVCFVPDPHHQWDGASL
jgi:hypothetical protein